MGSRGEVPCQGLGDEIPNVPRARSAHSRESERSRQATITILIYFDRILPLIQTGCALRWAQKDEGGYSDPPYIPLDSHYPLRNAGEL